MSLRLHGDTLVRPGMLDFAVNVWPGPRPPALEETLQHALAGSDRYPNEREARQAIAARHRRSGDEVLLLNGACEAFWLLAQTYRLRVSACIHPSFTEPEVALRAAGAALARHGRLLVVDESFVDFVCAAEASLAGRVDVPGLVVVRSLTKLWALPGIRAGYLLAAAGVVEALAAQRQPWGVNALACAALEACATDRQMPAAVAAAVAAARAELVDELRQLPGVHVWPGQANFLLLRVPDGARLVEALRDREIAVRPAASFPGLDDNAIRIAVRTPGENQLLLDALRELV